MTQSFSNEDGKTKENAKPLKVLAAKLIPRKLENPER